MRMVNKYKPFPENTRIRLFPLPTPPEGKIEYAVMEIRGILYYTYLSPDKDAARNSYPYSVDQPRVVKKKIAYEDLI